MSLQVQHKHVFTGHSGSIYALAEGNTAAEILSGSSDRFIAAWDTALLQPAKFTAQFPAPVYSLLQLPHSVLAAGTGAGSIHFVDRQAKQEIKILQLHGAQVFDLAFSPKHGLLFSAGADGQLGVIMPDDFRLDRIRKLCDGKLRGLAVSPDESMLAVACGDGNIRIFSLPDMRELFCFAAHGMSANAVCWHPQSQYLLSGGRDAYLRAWDPADAFSEKIAVPAHNFAIYSIRFNPEGHLFATASRDKTVKIWDAATIGFLMRLDHEKKGGHINSVNRLLWNAHGLISAGDDRSIIQWTVSSSGNQEHQ